MEYVKCNICSKNNTKRLFIAKDRMFDFPKEFVIVKCQNCGLVYLNPRPTKQEIKKYYPKEYGPYQLPVVKKEREGILGIFQRGWKLQMARSERLLSLKDLPKGKALDIGCGAGLNLKRLKEEGWQAYGCDISLEAVRKARKLGVKVFKGELHKIKFSNKLFDVVIMSHLLEHLHNPLKVLKEICRILKDKGHLVISLPNFESSGARLFKQYWYPLDAPRHLYHFSLKTLEMLLKKTGFEILKAKYNPQSNHINITKSLDYLTKKKLSKVFNNKIIQRFFFPLNLFVALLREGDVITVSCKKS